MLKVSSVSLLKCSCLAICLVLCSTFVPRAGQAQSTVFDEQLLAELNQSITEGNLLASPSPAPAPVGFGPDYTVTKSGNGVVSVTVVNGEDYVACFIMRNGDVVGAGVKKRSNKGNKVNDLQSDGMGYNAGKGPKQEGDTIDCN